MKLKRERVEALNSVFRLFYDLPVVQTSGNDTSNKCLGRVCELCERVLNRQRPPKIVWINLRCSRKVIRRQRLLVAQHIDSTLAHRNLEHVTAVILHDYDTAILADLILQVLIGVLTNFESEVFDKLSADAGGTRGKLHARIGSLLEVPRLKDDTTS